MASTGSSSSRAASEPTTAGVDLVIGLTSFNDAETIGGVVAAAREGVTRFLGDAAARFVLADAGSADDTAARARAAVGDDLLEVSPPGRAADVLNLPYHGMPGRARALHAILSAARNLDARACVVMDAGVITVAPRWLHALARPVLAGEADFVSPAHRRHRFEGALTRSMVYPMCRALYGARLRQPAAGEFACSPRLLDRVLDEDDLWEREGAHAGIDLWLATSAASGELALAEAALGTRARHARGDHSPDLATTMAQVVGSLFVDVESRVERWQRVRGSVAVLQTGEPLQGPAPESRPIEAGPLIDAYRLAWRELRDIWTWVLPPRTLVDLRRIVDLPAERFQVDDELWARIVYDFALGHRLRVLPRDHLLRSLVPLYLAWLASFVLRVGDAGDDEADACIERLCGAFEAQKPYLISRWRWPERLRT